MTTMDLLKRNLAPILPEAWKQIDEEARRVLKLNLAGRKLVDFSGPHGWRFAAVSTGALDPLSDEPMLGVSAGLRRVQPIVELRAPFRLSIPDLDAVARGKSPDLSAVVKAAEKIARVEDSAVFNGFKSGRIGGIIESSPHAPIQVTSTATWPQANAQAKEVLRTVGVGGPFALALGPKAYDELSAGSEDGYPLLKRIEKTLIDVPIVWAPTISGAVLMSTRGGDFELTVGQDFSIGFAYVEKQELELYLAESFTFRVTEPAAAIALRRA
jgi:uncharacterized linocin/CFP29 family protein